MYALTEEGFREKLRTAKPERGESFGQFMTRLEGYFNRWIELGHVDKTYQGLKDALLRGQAMSVVTRNLRIFIMERKPGSHDAMPLQTMATQPIVAVMKEHCPRGEAVITGHLRLSSMR